MRFEVLNWEEIGHTSLMKVIVASDGCAVDRVLSKPNHRLMVSHSHSCELLIGPPAIMGCCILGAMAPKPCMGMEAPGVD